MNIPVRQCAACREHFEKRQLLRIVRKPDGTIEIDDKGKVSGRGVYICKKEECLKKAIKTNAISRALEVPIGQDTVDLIRHKIGEAENG